MSRARSASCRGAGSAGVAGHHTQRSWLPAAQVRDWPVRLCALRCEMRRRDELEDLGPFMCPGGSVVTHRSPKYVAFFTFQRNGFLSWSQSGPPTQPGDGGFRLTDTLTEME